MNYIVLAGVVSEIDVSYSENGVVLVYFSITVDRLVLDGSAVGKAAEAVRDAGEGATMLLQGRLKRFTLVVRTAEVAPGIALNRVGLVGNSGRDVEISSTKNGKSVAKVSLAVKVGNDETAWYPVRLWERNARTASNYVGKGSIVAVDRCLELDQWTDREGKPNSRLSVNADTLHLIRTKKPSQSDAESSAGIEEGGDEYDDSKIPF